MSISAVTFDTFGRVVSWNEGDYAFSVRRDTVGRPVFVRASSPGRSALSAEFKYTGPSGAFSGLVGSQIESNMITHLVRDAMFTGGKTYATIAALVADSASNYAVGTVAYVGPSVDGSHSEWYSNGVIWRPRGNYLYVQNMPLSLPDTTTTETDIWSMTLPGSLIGPNDTLRFEYFWTYTNSAANKTFKLYFGSVLVMNSGTATGSGFRGTTYLTMRNSKTAQMFPQNSFGVAFSDGNASSGSFSTASVDTNSDVIVRASGTWGTAGGGAANITLQRIAMRIDYAA